MRLIDADELCKACKERGSECTGNACEVPTMPTISAEPVVRCRECIKHGTEYCPMMNHYIGEDETEPDDFCSYGQRKEADHEVS